MRYIILFALAIFSLKSAIAQEEVCGTEVSPEQVIELENLLSRPSGFNSRLFNVQVNIPIKAHIIRRSDGSGGLTVNALTTAINKLNTDYTQANIQFTLIESVNFIDNTAFFDFNSNQEGAVSVANDVPNVINIYFFNSITSGGSALCGYTYLPPAADRVFMTNGCTTNGSTLSHELGHYFSLYHTHGKTNTGTTDELVNGANCTTAGDNVCDTPADPNLTGAVNGSCQYTGGARDANGQLFSPMVNNLMSYAPDNCRNVFTAGQYERIRTGFENGRSNLSFTSQGFTVFFSAEQREGCEGLEVKFNSNTFGATSYNWVFEGGSPATSSSPNPTVTFNNPGKFDVSISVRNNAGETASFQRANYIEVIDPLAEATKEPVDLNFSNPEIPDFIKIENPDLAITFDIIDVSRDNDGTNSLFVNNYDYQKDVGGDHDRFIFPTFDIRGVKGLNITFDYAYTYRPGVASGNEILPNIYDSLSVELDTDCEAPPFSIWKRGGADLQTAPASSEVFVPSGSGQWQKATIFFPNNSNALFADLALTNISYGGNNLYIDNLVVIPDYTVDAPTNLRLLRNDPGSVYIRWNDGSNNEQGFLVERSIDGGPYEKVDSLAANTFEYTDTSISMAGLYTYRIVAKGVEEENNSISNLLDVQVTIVTSVDPEELSGLNVWPNPVDQTLNISTAHFDRFTIMDLAGKIMMSGELLRNETSEIVVAHLHPGVYLLHVENNVKSSVVKIIRR